MHLILLKSALYALYGSKSLTTTSGLNLFILLCNEKNEYANIGSLNKLEKNVGIFRVLLSLKDICRLFTSFVSKNLDRKLYAFPPHTTRTSRFFSKCSII